MRYVCAKVDGKNDEKKISTVVCSSISTVYIKIDKIILRDSFFIDFLRDLYENKINKKTIQILLVQVSFLMDIN